MKQFFYIVFGGLLAIGCGLLISYIGVNAWKKVGTNIINFKNKIEDRAMSQSQSFVEDVTSLSSSGRTIRYTASEEEGIADTFGVSSTTKITAKAYILLNVKTGEVVANKNEQQLLPIASLVKLVTAVVASDRISPNKKIVLDKKIMSAYGNTAQFRIGETFTVSDLMYPLLMVSSNDSAEALAQSYGRSKFVKVMNDFTQSIGAYRTYIFDPAGISPKNISTAEDIAIIFEWIYKNRPDIIEITKEKTHTIRSHTWMNPTHLLNQSSYIGGKNGYIPEAGRTGVSMFRFVDTGNEYIVVVLGSKNRDRDVATLIQRLK